MRPRGQLVQTLVGDVTIEASNEITVATGVGEEDDVSLETPPTAEDVLGDDESAVVALLDETGPPFGKPTPVDKYE